MNVKRRVFYAQLLRNAYFAKLCTTNYSYVPTR